MLKGYIKSIDFIFFILHITFTHTYLAMDFFLCRLVLLSRVFLVTPIGLYYDFIMITDFSNKVLKNNLTEVSQSSSRSLLDCSTQCGPCCCCFGFNTLTKVCRVFKTCDKADVTENEEGWIYHSIKESAELGEINFTVIFKLLARCVIYPPISRGRN